MNNDSKELELIYEQINEGIWTSVKGLGSGIKAGLKQGTQNLMAGVANKRGADVVPTWERGKPDSMGQAYSKAQQKSIFNSFLSTVEKETNEFKEDVQHLTTPGKYSIVTTPVPPEITRIIQKVELLLSYIKRQQQTLDAVNTL